MDGFPHGTHFNSPIHPLALKRSNSCPCFKNNPSFDTVFHTLAESAHYATIREECFSKIQRVSPNFSALSLEKKIDYILRDDVPKEIDVIIYRFLYKIFREARPKLVEPTRPGQDQSITP